MSRPVGEIGSRNTSGVPYLQPEIQLFYKAKSRRPRDDVDFAAILPRLDAKQRAWLRAVLTTTHGDDHPRLSTIE